MSDELEQTQAGLELLIVQPRPHELRMAVVTKIGVLDPEARLLTDWVGGRMVSGSSGHFIEFWDLNEHGDRIKWHEAHVGDAILQWPDGTWQVVPAREVDRDVIRVGSEMYWGKTNPEGDGDAHRELHD